ncbi:hypothetical protein LT85_0505 [Collimonas arenae]|uniref:Uncharacterized protein n=1 Tax=Collimonas arenae TaxID=279058 RepID=A0A0A1F792_9BURK|nr:hypothetical protein LT85_0505 [Collimonas arenae]
MPRGGGRPSTSAAGDIRNLEPARITRQVLYPASVANAAEIADQDFNQLAAALAQPAQAVDRALAPLIDFLGPLLTIASPAWSGDPVPRMRDLQKILVAHSLTLDRAERDPCLAAISVVEQAVTLRLRLQQLRMSELDMLDSGSDLKERR